MLKRKVAQINSIPKESSELFSSDSINNTHAKGLLSTLFGQVSVHELLKSLSAVPLRESQRIIVIVIAGAA